MPRKKIASGRAWLFYKAGNNKLIISAHGGAPDDNKKFDCPGTGWSVVVYRTSVYGLCTTSQVQDIIDYKNHNGPWGTGGNTWQQSAMSGKQTDWVLAKFASSSGGADDPDSYSNYEHLAETEGFDIASPRDTFFHKEINVSKILAAIPDKENYKEVWFSFCLAK